MNLQDQRIAVVGGASGIGRATVVRLAEAGADVVIGDINAELGEALATETGSTFIAVDLTDPASIDTFVAKILAGAPKLNGFVYSAGWNRVQPFSQTERAFWSQVMAINLMGLIQITHGLLPSLIETGGAHIVNISSDAGRVGSGGEAVYSAAKGGVIGFTKAMARELARNGITVNCVCPGPTDTPLYHASAPPKMQEALARAIPLRRVAQPEEIADAVHFFLTGQSNYVTGQVLSVSGGLTMHG